jgi:hypothetical protein
MAESCPIGFCPKPQERRQHRREQDRPIGVALDELRIGESECTRLATELEETLRDLCSDLDDEQLDEVIRTVVRAWLSGFRFGMAEVVAQTDRMGVQLQFS